MQLPTCTLTTHTGRETSQRTRLLRRKIGQPRLSCTSRQMSATCCDPPHLREIHTKSRIRGQSECTWGRVLTNSAKAHVSVAWTPAMLNVSRVSGCLEYTRERAWTNSVRTARPNPIQSIPAPRAFANTNAGLCVSCDCEHASRTRDARVCVGAARDLPKCNAIKLVSVACEHASRTIDARRKRFICQNAMQ